MSFKCKSGLTLPPGLKCNNNIDCFHGDDEWPVNQDCEDVIKIIF